METKTGDVVGACLGRPQVPRPVIMRGVSSIDPSVGGTLWRNCRNCENCGDRVSGCIESIAKRLTRAFCSREHNSKRFNYFIFPLVPAQKIHTSTNLVIHVKNLHKIIALAQERKA